MRPMLIAGIDRNRPTEPERQIERIPSANQVEQAYHSKEFADYGVTVNAIAPPAIRTDLIKGVPKEKIDRLLKRQSIHRFGEPEEICNVIDFFVKQESSLITGEVIYMGGV